MRIRRTVFALLAAATLFAAPPALALEGAAAERFAAVMDLSLEELGEAAAERLAATYPEEDWAAYGFPGYVHADRATEAAYRVAVKRPALLGKANVQDEARVVPCYCTCDTFGHDNLLYCFFDKGEAGGRFDEHGAQCAVCIRQALLAYLWDDLGASHAEIMEGMRLKFAPLIEKYHGRH